MSSLSSLTGNSLNFTGLATGIDTSKIVDGLTSITSRQIQNMQSQKAQIVQKQTVFGGLQTKLFDLQSQVSRVARSIAGAFDGRKATSSDEDLLTATASSSAQNGSYTLTVNQLAQAQQVASTGLADPNTNIKTGSVALKVGSGGSTTITIDSSNNTLQGLANAINNANADVKASIVKDGSSTPYRLLLTSNKTGAANTISVTNNLTGGSGETVNLTSSVIQAGADAQVKIGSGAGALTLTSASNRIDGAITGVTLNLTQADAAKPVTLNVQSDTDTAKKALEDFVASYNGIADFIDERDNYDSQTQQAGIFLGNRDVLELQNDLENALSSSVGGVNQKLNRLNAAGISFTDKGRLQLDSSKLQSALNGQVDGVSLNDFRRLFALTGESTNPGVNFLLGSDKTKPSGATPYQVNISRAATRASISGTNALAGPVTIDGTNNSFVVKVNNLTSSLITIDAGTYTSSSLAATIQTLINANTALAGGQVAVDLDAGRLRVASQIFGNASQVSFASGTALSALGFVGTEVGVGQDVAGSFRVNGVTEAATGLGQVLSGKSGNANTDGLQVRVALDTTAVGGGVSSNMKVTQGIGSRLSQVLNKYLDPIDGRFKTVDNQFKQNLDNLDDRITKTNESLENKKQSLVQQFAAMEGTVSSLKNLGSQIASSFGKS